MDFANEVAESLDKRFNSGVFSAMQLMRTSDFLHRFSPPDLLLACAVLNGSDDQVEPLTAMANSAESMLSEMQEMIKVLLSLDDSGKAAQ